MTQKRRRCDKQFKIAAARVVLGGEMRAVDLARELGVKDPTLRRWAQGHGEMGESAFPGNGRPKVDKDYEIAKLRKRIEEPGRENLVGWSMSGRMTEKPVADALEQAVGREGPPDDFSLVFHDDQGSQHASRAFRRRLESHGIARSMSRPGNLWGDAPAESLFKTPEREPVNGKGCKTREEAKQDAFEYIEPCYNRRRMRSSIGYNAPCNLERDIA